jgi:hypothetical protein
MRLVRRILLLAATIPTMAWAQEVKYRGVCDASAAVALDSNHFVVAEDEIDNLIIYRRGEPEPLAKVDIVDYLGNRKPTGKVKEADIEGAARIGLRIYWIASHGRDKNAHVEETRWRFFATDIVETGSIPGVKPVAAPPYKKLLQDMIAEQKLAPLGLAAAAEKAPEDPGGLNIEGLASTPEGQLFIGFRNPRPGNKAIILPLTNPDMVTGGAKPTFGEANLIDLGGRGVRSIERIGDRYVIIAGPFDDGKGGSPGSDFAIFTWSGKTAETPRRVETNALSTMRPEAVFEIIGTNQVHILSDDGDEKIDGEKCKDTSAEKRSFRGITLSLP